MLDVGIGMGYVRPRRAEPGTELEIDVRGKERRARVAKKPLYKEGVVTWPRASRIRTTCKYHPEHDWARIDGDEAVLGITWFAQDALGELVHFEPPDVGATSRRTPPTARSSR